MGSEVKEFKFKVDEMDVFLNFCVFEVDDLEMKVCEYSLENEKLREIFGGMEVEF